MKKILISIFLFIVLCFNLVGCAKDKEETYFPNRNEMQTNLEKFGYEVSIENNIDNKYNAIHLYAAQNNEYIEFYWLNSEEFIDDISKELESKYGNCEEFVSMENDDKFGTLVFCGTERAVDASGIKIVDVKVKVQ